MRQLQERLAGSGVTLEFTPAFEDYMTDAGYDPSYGARPVKRVMQRELVNLLAKAVLDGTIRKDSTVKVDSAGGRIVLTN